MPFLNIKSGKLSIKYIYTKLGEQSAEITFLFMIYVFNYIVGIWEPMIEKSKGLIKYKSFNSDNFIEIKFDEKALNINICDLHISFLYHIFIRWNNSLKEDNLNSKKSFKESKNDKKEKEKKIKISNHILQKGV